MSTSVEWMERHQVALYVLGLALGSAVGLAWPAVAQPAENTIHPLLALLLYATFLGIPFTRIRQAFKDGRFLCAILFTNFVLVPLVVWPLSRIVASNQVLLIGVLFVLLTPCIDYVIAFTGLAGGDEGRLLAASPLLMVAQTLLLPLYLWLFHRPGVRRFGRFHAIRGSILLHHCSAPGRCSAHPVCRGAFHSLAEVPGNRYGHNGAAHGCHARCSGRLTDCGSPGEARVTSAGGARVRPFRRRDAADGDAGRKSRGR